MNLEKNWNNTAYYRFGKKVEFLVGKNLSDKLKAKNKPVPKYISA